jgi:uncharacterized protein (TIGR03437 family)
VRLALILLVVTAHARDFPGLEIHAMVAAPDGSILVGGFARQAGLPITANAFNPSICGVVPGPGLVPNPCGDGYVARLSPAGDVLYGSYLGGAGTDDLASIAVAPNGDAFLLGLSRSPEFRTGRGPYVIQLHPDGTIGFARALFSDPDFTPVAIAANADVVVAAGFLTRVDAHSGAPIFTKTLDNTPSALALDPDGNIYYAGATFLTFVSAAGDRVTTTILRTGPFHIVERIAIAPNRDVIVAGLTLASANWIDRYPPDLSAPRFSRTLDIYTSVTAILPQADGSILLYGNTQSNFFPVTPDAAERCPAPSFVARLSSDGAAIQYASFLSVPAILYAGGGFAASQSSVVQLDLAPAPRLCAVNSASFGNFLTWTGEIVTIFGADLTAARVLVNGVPAALLYNSESQLNIDVPPLAPAKNLDITIERAGKPALALTAPAVDRAPGLFRIYTTSRAAALNADGTINGPDHPAPPGTTLTLFGTGFGPAPPIRVFLNQTEAPVISLVQPDGFHRIEIAIPAVAPGAYPVNFQVGTLFQLGFVEISVGDAPAQRL